MESVPDLILCLCEHHINQNGTNVKERLKATRDRNILKRQLKRKAFETIFQYLKDNEKGQATAKNVHLLGVLDELSARCYALRSQRHYDDALKLDLLLANLSKKDELNEHMKSILKLLLCLQDTGQLLPPDAIGHSSEFQHEAFTQQAVAASVHHDEVRIYGDTKIDVPITYKYMHYPSNVFEKKGIVASHLGTAKYPSVNNEIFLLRPGTDLSSKKEVDKNSYECWNSTSLFGALVKARGQTVDLRLDIPDLPSDASGTALELKIPKVTENLKIASGRKTMHIKPEESPVAGPHTRGGQPLDSRRQLTDGLDPCEDEGFADEASSSGVSSLNSPVLNVRSSATDIWEEACSHQLTRHHTWENLGVFVLKPERPYLTEAGPEAFNHICSYHHRQLQVVDPALQMPPVNMISTKRLVKDLLNLLIGLPSDSFPLNKDIFSVSEGLFISGISPAAVGELCSGAVQCGIDFLRLSRFAEARQPRSTDRFGLVLESFRSAIRKYLQHYEACILSIPSSDTVLEVVNAFQKAMNQMRFLAQLCMCSGDGEDDDFPVGCHLLSYLYNECLATDASEHGHLMLSLLQTTCTPYLILVQDWVFHGMCRDQYGEFMLQANEDYLRFRDGHYWTEGYTLVDPDPLKAAPSFLADLTYDIFLCGKSINLLRLCNPQHFLLMEELSSLPQLRLTFSETELVSHERNAQIYLGRMQAIARQHSRTRQDMKIQAEKAKQELMARAHKMAAEELQRLQVRILDSRRRQDQKKRLLFAELKQHSEQEKKRKEEEKAKEKQQDKTRMESSSKQELLEATVNSELERQAREELAEYYAKLSEVAVLREQRALWRVRRHRLDPKRMDFLHAEEMQMKEEMLKVSPSLSSDPSTHPYLPGPGLDDKLPRWAQSASETRYADEKSKEEPSSQADVSLIGNVDLSDLPLWAQKALETSDSTRINSLVLPGDDSSSGDQKEVCAETLESEDTELTRMEGVAKSSEEGKQSLLTNAGNEKGSMIEKAVECNITNTKVESEENIESGIDSGTNELKELNIVQISAESENGDMVTDDVQGKELSDPGLLPQKSDIIHLKRNESQHVGKESEEESVTKSHVKMSPFMNATTETEEQPQKSHLKTVPGKSSTLESKADHLEHRQHLKMNPVMNATKESEAAAPKFRPPNIFGHISQISRMEFDVPAPHLKRNSEMHATKESEWNEFSSYQIRPRHRKPVEGQSIDKETTSDDGQMPGYHLRTSQTVNSLTESEHVDLDAARTERFRARNVHGHSSDSSVQALLYGERDSGQKKLEDVTEESGLTSDMLQQFWVDLGAERYTDDHKYLDSLSVIDLMPWKHSANAVTTEMADLQLSQSGSFISLPFFIKRSIMAPLAAQILLVNQSVINYFLVDKEIENHFLTLQRFLVLQDGEFSQSLCNQLFEKLALSCLPSELLNPMFLNTVLQKAMASSLSADSVFSQGVSFVVKFLPQFLQKNAPDALDCLELTYKVDWPVNIIINESCLRKYGQIFNFMLKLRRAVWILNDIFYRLKRDAMVHSAGNSAELRKLQLWRHEMQHFAKVIEEYIASQVIHVSWHEFQGSLSTQINSFDDLIQCHTDYLNRCIARCLLNKKASPIMKIMHDIFGVILAFNSQLISHSWQKQPDSGRIFHPAFSLLQATYQSFHDQSMFLFKVVGKIAERGYQPHFQDLLVRLGFNDFYKLDKFVAEN